MSFYINGVFDSITLETLKTIGIKNIGLDLRPLSSNLITYTDFKVMLPLVKDLRTSLIFENDSLSTINSFLDIAGDHKKELVLQFRDQRPVSFYRELNHPFEWMFHPDADWREIFSLNHFQSVLLPIEWRDYYQNKPSFWHLIEERRIQVHVYVSSFKQAATIEGIENLSLAIDLGLDFIDSYRKINQDKLKKLKEQDRRNETLAR